MPVREHGCAQRFDYVTGATVMEVHYVNGVKEGQEIIIQEHGNDTRSQTVRHYKNGKLDGPFLLESARNGKPYITVKGEYADGKRCGRWKRYDAAADTKEEWDE